MIRSNVDRDHDCDAEYGDNQSEDDASGEAHACTCLAAAKPSSSKVAFPSPTKPAQCSAGMLFRLIHDLTVWTDTPRAQATSSAVPARFTISECVCICQ